MASKLHLERANNHWQAYPMPTKTISLVIVRVQDTERPGLAEDTIQLAVSYDRPGRVA